MKSNTVESENQTSKPGERKKRILVFSPDVDVATSLTLFLEDRFDVACESELDSFKEKLSTWHPAIILADVHPLPADIMKLVEILKGKPNGSMVILLHVYRNWAPDIETAIRTVGDFVFYKPVNVEMIANLISDLVEGRQQHHKTNSTSGSKE